MLRWGAFDVVLAADVVYPTKDLRLFKATCYLSVNNFMLKLSYHY